ncbi:MAG: TatD family hydrolase [Spirochaetia bacterium]
MKISSYSRFLLINLISDTIQSMSELQILLQRAMPIDTHFHYFHCLDKSPQAKDDLIFAFANGMRIAVDAGTPSHSFAQRKILADAHSGLFLLSGHHPDTCKADFIMDIAQLKEELLYEKNIALGEIGLDYSYDIPINVQQQAFHAQLQLGKSLGKPVVLHVRDAHEDALAIIQEHDIHAGIVHCFTGDVKTAKAWLDQGFYLSYSGITTFKNAVSVQESAVYTPIDRLFCETDAPFLAPVPHRGAPNQLGFVAYVYLFVAQLKCQPIQEFSDQLAANFHKFITSKN